MRTNRAVFVLAVTGAAACAVGTRPKSGPPAGMPESHVMSMPGAGAATPSAYSAEVQAGYAKVRAATASFRVLDSAVANGYAKDVAQCFADSIYDSGGAMGYHHVNRQYLDAKVEIEHPEIVMYERKPDGKYEMTGVEYIVPYRFWPKDSVPPKLMGRPMVQENERNYWYSHMWVWKPSSAGLFADWNPAVKCPPKAGP